MIVRRLIDSTTIGVSTSISTAVTATATTFKTTTTVRLIRTSVIILSVFIGSLDMWSVGRTPRMVVTVTAFTASTTPWVSTTTTTKTTTPTMNNHRYRNLPRRRNLSVLFSNIPKLKINSNSNNNNYNNNNIHNSNNNNNNNIINYNNDGPASPPSSMTDLEKKYLHTTASVDSGQTNTPIPLLGGGGYHRPVVQWYPGHIAKAERALGVTMKAVDVIVEVRDARIPAATSHPSVASQWCQNKPRIIVLTHMDAIPRSALQSWYQALLQSNEIGDGTNKTPSGNFTKSGRLLAATTAAADKKNNAAAPLPLSPNQLIQNQAAQVETVRLQYQPTSQVATPTSAAKAVAKRNKMKRSAVLSGTNRGKSSSSATTIRTIPAKAVIFVNAKMGVGIHGLTRAILAAGQHIQDRRIARGLLNRPLRVGVLGYPNVGKSALINKLIGRRRCATANLPGVTRSLQWIRVKHDTVNSNTNSKAKKTQEFELLDSPGIIPAVLADQSDAMLLAACHCIGEASYDNQAVAAYLCEWLLAVHTLSYHKLVAPHWRTKVIERYKFDPITKAKPKQLYPHEEVEADENTTNRGPSSHRLTGEDMLYLVADQTCQGDPEDAARKILQDFRAGRMGPICLQVAPVVGGSGTNDDHHHQNDIGVHRNNAVASPVLPPVVVDDDATEQQINFIREMMNDPDDIVWQIQKQQRRLEQEQQQQRSIATALDNMKSRGMELPQSVLSLSTTETNDTNPNNDENNDTNTATSTTEQQQKPNGPVTPTSMIGKGLFEGW